MLGRCCRTQDFEKAGSLRDREMELKAQISAITGAAKEESAAEVASQLSLMYCCHTKIYSKSRKLTSHLISPRFLACFC